MLLLKNLQNFQLGIKIIPIQTHQHIDISGF
jgi:hypothetical protein